MNTSSMNAFIRLLDFIRKNIPRDKFLCGTLYESNSKRYGMYNFEEWFPKLLSFYERNRNLKNRSEFLSLVRENYSLYNSRVDSMRSLIVKPPSYLYFHDELYEVEYIDYTIKDSNFEYNVFLS